MKKDSILIFLLVCLNGFSQLNIPAHFTYVNEVNYNEYLGDSPQVYEQKIGK